MAIPVNINDLINQRIVKSTRLEFKSDWNPNPILHSICAFLPMILKTWAVAIL